MSSSLPEISIGHDSEPTQRQETARRRPHPLFTGLKRLEDALRAGRMTPTTYAIGTFALNHLSDAQDYRKGRDIIAGMFRLSDKTVTRAFKELCADGPFKIFECRRRVTGTNVYAFVWQPEDFIKSRDAGRARAAMRARAYHDSLHEQRLRLQVQRADMGLGGTLTVEEYESKVAELRVKARTRANGKVLPDHVLPR